MMSASPRRRTHTTSGGSCKRSLASVLLASGLCLLRPSPDPYVVQAVELPGIQCQSYQVPFTLNTTEVCPGAIHAEIVLAVGQALNHFSYHEGEWHARETSAYPGFLKEVTNTIMPKLGLCQADCDVDTDCAPGLWCADAHKPELAAKGLDQRKANCGTVDTGDWNHEVCFDPAILSTTRRQLRGGSGGGDGGGIVVPTTPEGVEESEDDEEDEGETAPQEQEDGHFDDVFAVDSDDDDGYDSGDFSSAEERTASAATVSRTIATKQQQQQQQQQKQRSRELCNATCRTRCEHSDAPKCLLLRCDRCDDRRRRRTRERRRRTTSTTGLTEAQFQQQLTTLATSKLRELSTSTALGLGPNCRAFLQTATCSVVA